MRRVAKEKQASVVEEIEFGREKWYIRLKFDGLVHGTHDHRFLSP